MVKKSQEEEIITMLRREGFRELSRNEIETEPYKSVYMVSECLTCNTDQAWVLGVSADQPNLPPQQH